ncbi:MAG: NAD(P)/FAD-dependent oxidoreductase [Pseudomonadota bacterium]
MLRVAVIGAGIAGLSCASRLAEAGFRVDVFEKSRGTGGRLNTRRDHGTAFDLGAQYFTVRDPRFAAAVDAWAQAGAAARWDFSPWIIDAQGKVLPSPDNTERWVGAPTMTALTQQLAGRNVVLCTQTTIDAVERRHGLWTLYAGEALSFEGFHALVVAVPAPQALRFVQASPALAAAARAAVLEPCWSVAIGFEQPTGLLMEGAFARGQPVSWLARNSGKPGRAGSPEVWVLHAAPAWSEEHLEAPPEAVARHLLRWFQTAFRLEDREAAWLHAHRWRFARTAHRVAEGHPFDERLQLGLCGDWCGGGRVEGAWLSGRGLADVLTAIHRI